MQQTIFYIIIGLILFDYLFERLLEVLDLRNLSNTLPKPFQGVYEAEKYRKSQDYTRENTRFGFYTSTFSLILILLMLFLGGFSLVDNWARYITGSPLLVPLVFFGILGLVFDLLNTPFSLYDTFVIEEKYGFNKMNLKIFVGDKLKSWLLGAVIGGGLLLLIVWFYQLTGKLFWIYAWSLVTVFMIFMTLFYSSLIVPLFNKQTPLEEGSLRKGIEKFCDKVDFKLDNVFVIDGSKRSTKSNAYFSGLGKKKRIVLYDTLIKDLSEEEIIAVLAHEVGHYKKMHTRTGLILSVLQTGLTLYILSLFINSEVLSAALGVQHAAFHINLIAFGLLYSPISMLLGLGMNVISRKNEYEADSFAKENYSGPSLASALKMLTVKNLGNLQPHPFSVFFHYSHPTVLQRLEKLES